MKATGSRISHVCISDLHAGALSSVVTRLDRKLCYEPGQPSATNAALGPALTKTLRTLNGDAAPPDLILLGDALELSASPPERSCDVLSTFLAVLYAEPAALFNRIVFVPGNHDHAIWTAERYATREFGGGGAGRLGDYQHISPAFAAPATCRHSRLLEQILSGLKLSVTVPTYYPNFGLTPEDGQRVVVFHHGHFIEPMYRVMTGLVAALSGRKGVELNCEASNQTPPA